MDAPESSRIAEKSSNQALERTGVEDEFSSRHWRREAVKKGACRETRP